MTTEYRIFDAAEIAGSIQKTQPWPFTINGKNIDDALRVALEMAEDTTHVRVELVDEDGDVIDAREGKTALTRHEDEDGYVTWACTEGGATAARVSAEVADTDLEAVEPH